MKYIRTKYWIFNCVKREEDKFYTDNINYIYRKDIIKQADTIEELCDEFVVYLKGENNNLPLNFDNFQLPIFKQSILLGMKGKIECWLKGAIWTSTGLIYVTKMNEKGELELL